MREEEWKRGAQDSVGLQCDYDSSGREAPDVVNHPPHYKSLSMEVIDVIESFSLGFHLGNSVKYILRAGKKGDAKEDLKKAIWYLNRAIDKELV